MNLKVLEEHYMVLLLLQKDLRLESVAIVNMFRQQSVSVI
jgi:hypothetical protein